MPIKFFATNRALDGLSRVNRGKRESRIDLQAGGYYFVDMEKYTAHYLEELDDKAPVSAVIQNSREIVFDHFLKDDRIGRVVICVHGFNQSLQAAQDWFSVMVDTLRNDPDYGQKIVSEPQHLVGLDDGSATAFIGFSWPSNGNVLSYASDQRDAQASGGAFINLLIRIALYGKPISLICHSMGNFMAANALAGLVRREYYPASLNLEQIQKLAALDDNAAKARLEHILAMISRPAASTDNIALVDQFLMIAPDVERRHVTKGLEDDQEAWVGKFYSGIDNLVGTAVNVFSRYDSALAISNLEKKPREALEGARSVADWITFGVFEALEENTQNKWEKRLGLSRHPSNAPANMISLNAAEIAQRPIGHGDHVDSPAITRRLAELLGLS